MRVLRFKKVPSALGVLSLLVLALVIASSFFPSPASGQIEKTRVVTPPQLVSFQINNGATATTSWTVTLNNVVKGSVTQYRASMKPDFSDPEGAWKPYSNAPTFEIPHQFSHVDIYFQVRYYEGGRLIKPIEHKSNRVLDSIDINPGPQEYTVVAGTAYQFAKNQRWTFNCSVDMGLTQRCYIEVPGSGDLILQTLGQPRDTFGSKANFVLFSGRELNPGWTFKLLRFYPANCRASNKNHTVEQWPNEGSRNITVRIHMWTNSGDTCEVSMGDMVLVGPPWRTWQDAFR